MSLRARILALFLGLGVVPILLLGGIGYARSMRAVRGFLEEQTSAIARQVASELEDRHARRLSELLLLVENAETQRLYRTRADTGRAAADSALLAAEQYLSAAWDRLGGSYRQIELFDLDDRSILSLGSPDGSRAATPAVAADPSPGARVRVPVLDLETGEDTGVLSAEVLLPTVLPREALEVSFGRSGTSVVLDRREGVILHHPSRRFVHQPLSALLGPDGWDVDVGTLASGSGTFHFSRADSTHVASFVSLTDPPWTVVSMAALDEFAPPFRGARRGDLLIVLLVAALVGSAFVVTTHRVTASLEALTEASERVGRGDLNPPLPVPGPDEVGRLSAAFRLMVEQVREMLRRVEEAREMAVMGELTSSVSHQIRNPLTSIKLNLQGLEEEARSEGMSERSIRSLQICLREVGHLEEAVRQMRQLARTHPPDRVESSLHALLAQSVELLRSQLEAHGVTVEMKLGASRDTVLADPEELKSVFVNLLVNAEEAMEGGGSVHVTTSNPPGAVTDGTVLVELRDEGPGVPEEARERIFRPFVTTKKDGTGFGLAIARLTVQEHQGTIRVGPGGPGATFQVELPLVREPGVTSEEEEHSGWGAHAGRAKVSS
jgi:signal transduction histidine kinase